MIAFGISITAEATYCLLHCFNRRIPYIIKLHATSHILGNLVTLSSQQYAIPENITEFNKVCQCKLFKSLAMTMNRHYPHSLLNERIMISLII